MAEARTPYQLADGTVVPSVTEVLGVIPKPQLDRWHLWYGVDMKTPTERFWAKVDTPSEGCWNWRGASWNGYGLFWLNGKMTYAHRFAYEGQKGAIPDGLVIDHLCRNPSCQRGDHLEAVTRGENVLRGNGYSGRALRRTHCPQGHEYTPENTFRPTRKNGRKGERNCRACKRARDKASSAAA